MDRKVLLFSGSLLLASGCGLLLDAGPPRVDAAVGQGLDAGHRLDASGDGALPDVPLADVLPPSLPDAALDVGPLFDAALDAAHADASSPVDAFVPNPCDGLDPGAECASDPRRICIEGRCVPSRCGDGMVDGDAGEECDPLDPSADTACQDCRYECMRDGDCAITPCTQAGCTGNRCAYSIVAFGTPCPTMDEPLAICAGGYCRPPSCGNGASEPGEDCDVGSRPTAGCVGCRHSCRTAAECADGDPCNGEEYCAPGEGGQVCYPAVTGILCAPRACESGRCVTGPTGTADCEYSLLPTLDVDGDGYPNRSGCGVPVDCNDGNPEVNPGALEVCAPIGAPDVNDDCNDATVGGTVRQWCPDEDGDGFGSADLGRSMMSCPQPLGFAFEYTLDCSDCFDAGGSSAGVAALVHPGQRSFYATPYCSAGGGPCSYDYDCDGRLTLQFDEVETCRFLLGCANRDGWQDRVPGCGERHTWITCRGFGACVEADETRGQGCR